MSCESEIPGRRQQKLNHANPKVSSVPQIPRMLHQIRIHSHVGALTNLVSEMCASGSDLVSEWHFPKNFSRIAFAQMFYFRKENFIGCRDFYFWPSSKMLIWKKVRWLFREQKNSKSSDFFRKSEKFSMKNQWKSKFFDFQNFEIFDFHWFSFDFFCDFRKISEDFENFALEKKSPNFFQIKILNLVKK